MIPRIITKENLCKWVDEIAQEMPFFAPIETNSPKKGEKNYEYRRIKQSGQIAFDFDRTRISPKGFFFKPEEKLMTASLTKGAPKAVEIQKEQQVLFGVRPCDITALNLLDKVFLDDKYPDPYYSAHRQRTTVIGMRCVKECRTCFCGTMESYNPKNGYDLMLTELPTGDYLVESGSHEGVEIVMKHYDLSREVTDQDRRVILANFIAIDNTFKTHVPMIGTRSIVELSTKGEIWKKYEETCLSCGQCVFVCPTCWCFDVKEKVAADSSDPGNIDNTLRYRVWGSCLFKEFHTVAGGHVFKPTTASRLENYYKHKIKGIPERFGMWGCIGCGRCYSTCPVGIDIRESISEIAGVK